MSEEHEHSHGSKEDSHTCQTCSKDFETEEELEKHENHFHMDFLWKIKQKLNILTKV